MATGTSDFPLSSQLALTAATPYRKTRVVFGLPEYRTLRRSWSAHPRGASLASASGQPAGRNLNITRLPSDSWCISSWEMMFQFERQEALGTLIVPPSVATPVEYASDVEQFVSQATIPGVTYDSSVVTLGCYWARKRKKASSDWHQELGADVAAFIKPALPTQNAPMRRIAHQITAALDVNQGVFLRFRGPGSPLASTDAFLTFYFGGSVPGTAWDNPAVTVQGGMFAVSLFGDGTIWLFERTVTAGTTLDGTQPWRLLDKWHWEDLGKVAGQQHVIIIIPEGHDRLNFLGSGGLYRTFTADSRTAGYKFKASMTGRGDAAAPDGPTGGLRLDMREDLRLPFQFGSLSFPPGANNTAPSGTALYGKPIKVLYPLAAGASIIPEPDNELNGGAPMGTITVKMYDAKTNSALPGPAGDGSFTTLVSGQSDYYALFTLGGSGAGSVSRSYTPFLRGCNYRVAGQVALYTPTPFTGGQLREVAITGPDTEIDMEHASVLIEDEQAILADGPPGPPPLGGLDDHADIHCQIQTQYDPADPTKQWVLFDGILIRAAGTQRGKVPAAAPGSSGPQPFPAFFPNGGAAYPSPRWKQWRIELAGQWHRLSEDWQILWTAKDWTKDPLGVTDPVTHQPLPWRVIDIIAELLRQAGYDDSQIHMTNPPWTPATGIGGSLPGQRLFVDLQHPETRFVMPGVKLSILIQRLLKDYLNGYLIWDKEALPHGRWITVYDPVLSGTYTTLWTFRTEGPPSGTPVGMPVHVPSAWPTGTTFVRNYTRYVKPPEGNLFIVMVAPGPPSPPIVDTQRLIHQTPEERGSQGLSAAIGVNWRSTQFEGYPAPIPGHLDFVPYGIKPVVLYRPELATTGDVAATNENCRYRCRTAMNSGAYGKRHFEWLAPLIAYFDPDAVYGGGPRTLRTGDLVLFNENGTLRTVWLTSVNPMIGLPEGDLNQQAQYEGWELPVPLSY